MTFSTNIYNNKKGTATGTYIAANTTGEYTLHNYYPMTSGISQYTYNSNAALYFSERNLSNNIKFYASDNIVLPNLTTSLNGAYSNYIIVNNGTNNWTLTLPLGPTVSTNIWLSKSMQITIKKTGSGTLTIQTPIDSAGVRIRGINTISNKSYILSSTNTQSITLLYTSEILSDGTTDTTAEIWHVIKDVSLNPVSVNGSILFAGTTSTYLTLPANDNQLQFRTGDFTVEWWQYQTDSNNAPRIFSFGTYPSASFAVSIESGIFYLWINGLANSFGNVGTYKNIYTHFAVTRSGTTIRVFKNGSQLGSNLTSSYDFNNSTDNLRLGNEQTLSTGAAYGGSLKGFHWVKGTALYTTTFTPNYNSITPHANTYLLLNVSDSSNLVTDSSGLGKTVTNTGCTFSLRTHPFY